MCRLVDVIHEDDELLVMNKPAGLVCHPTKTDENSSLIGRVRQYVGAATHPHLVNRLDRETGGIVIVAKRDSAARELRRLWESRSVEKDYLAIVHGHMREDQGVIDTPLGKDEHSRVAIKDCVRADGLPSQTEFRVERRFVRDPTSLSARSAGGAGRDEGAAAPSTLNPQPFTLLQVCPLTGRKHQIRIHLAHLGHPVVGDKLYGGDEDLYLALVENRLTPKQRDRLVVPFHALHATAVRFAWHGRPLEFRCEPEPWFKELVAGNAGT